jgi:hypothetical protein
MRERLDLFEYNLQVFRRSDATNELQILEFKDLLKKLKL